MTAHITEPMMMTSKDVFTLWKAILTLHSTCRTSRMVESGYSLLSQLSNDFMLATWCFSGFLPLQKRNLGTLQGHKRKSGFYTQYEGIVWPMDIFIAGLPTCCATIYPMYTSAHLISVKYGTCTLVNWCCCYKVPRSADTTLSRSSFVRFRRMVSCCT